MSDDPGRWLAARDALAGAALYGLYNLALLYLSGRPVTGQDWRRALVNAACALASGAVAAFFIAPAATAFVPWTALRDVHAVSFAIGFFAWELAGVVLELARKRAAKLGEGGGQ